MTRATSHTGHLVKPSDRARISCAHNGCDAPAYWCEYSRFDTGLASYGKGIAFYYACREHGPEHIFDVTLRAGPRLYGERVAAATKADARDAALRQWFGDGVFWDTEDGRGRPVRQRLVRRHGKERFLEEPLAAWGKLSIREVRRG